MDEGTGEQTVGNIQVETELKLDAPETGPAYDDGDEDDDDGVANDRDPDPPLMARMLRHHTQLERRRAALTEEITGVEELIAELKQRPELAKDLDRWGRLSTRNY